MAGNDFGGMEVFVLARQWIKRLVESLLGGKKKCQRSNAARNVSLQEGQFAITADAVPYVLRDLGIDQRLHIYAQAMESGGRRRHGDGH